MIQINVCDTRWRTAFVAPSFPRLLAYMYTVAIAHAARIHTQESYLSLSSARVYRGRVYTCTSVCIGDVAHLSCDMRKLIVCSGIDALENQNPERPPPIDLLLPARMSRPSRATLAFIHIRPTFGNRDLWFRDYVPHIDFRDARSARLFAARKRNPFSLLFIVRGDGLS